jgi:hypothetical protein
MKRKKTPRSLKTRTKKQIKAEIKDIYKGLSEKLYMASFVDYVTVSRLDRKQKNEYNSKPNHIFKQKYSGFSSEASESFISLLIKKDILFKELGEKKTVTLTGKRRTETNDILINGKHAIEVKATSSDSGLVTVSKNNLNCYAWVWMDIRTLLNTDSNFVEIHIVRNPSENIFPWMIETNKESKMDIKTMIKDLKNTKDYEHISLDITSLSDGLEEQKQTKFFDFNV